MENQEKRATVPEFFMNPVQDFEKSEKAGHPVFRDVEYVKIHHPGSQFCIPCMKVKEKHKTLWPKHYAAFKAGEDAPLDGFPLTEWAAISRAIAETLRNAGVLTVEQLAAVPDQQLSYLGPMYQDLKNKAVVFIEEHNSEKAKIAVLEDQNKSLMERLEKLEAQSSEEKPTVVNSTKKEAPKAKAK